MKTIITNDFNYNNFQSIAMNLEPAAVESWLLNACIHHNITHAELGPQLVDSNETFYYPENSICKQFNLPSEDTMREDVIDLLDSCEGIISVDITIEEALGTFINYCQTSAGTNGFDGGHVAFVNLAEAKEYFVNVF